MQSQLSFPSYLITVNYAQTVKQLIIVGKYDWVSDDITSGHFPSNEKGNEVEVLIYLVNLKRHYVDREDAIKELDCLCLRPATLKELLAFGVAQTELQRNKPIVALGSMWRDSDGGINVPYLDGDGLGRYLRCRWLARGWPSRWQFAAVPK